MEDSNHSQLRLNTDSSHPSVKTGRSVGGLDAWPGVDPASGEPSEADQKTVISKKSPRSDWHFTPATARDLGKLLVGQQLGHYRLEEFVGGGGMGAVFRATDSELGRTVAVKVLSGTTNDEETLRRFKNEAQSAARLDHQNIARVHYVGADNGWHYIVFEFIQGVNIRDLVLRKGPLPIEEAIHYTLQVAEALDHAFQRDVVHRDIKPSNVLVMPNGHVKLVDMGLARLQQVDATNDLTASGVTLGTFDYISPEQAREPRNADVRSDLYSLGCTLYFMLTGQPPFPQGTVLQKLLSHSSDPPPDPRDLREDLGDGITEIVHRLLAKNPADRHQTPADLVGSLVLLAEDMGLELPGRAATVMVARPIPVASIVARQLAWVVPAAMLLVLVMVMELSSSARTITVRRPTLKPALKSPDDGARSVSSSDHSPDGIASPGESLERPKEGSTPPPSNEPSADSSPTSPSTSIPAQTDPTPAGQGSTTDASDGGSPPIPPQPAGNPNSGIPAPGAPGSDGRSSTTVVGATGAGPSAGLLPSGDGGSPEPTDATGPSSIGSVSSGAASSGSASSDRILTVPGLIYDPEMLGPREPGALAANGDSRDSTEGAPGTRTGEPSRSSTASSGSSQPMVESPTRESGQGVRPDFAPAVDSSIPGSPRAPTPGAAPREQVTRIVVADGSDAIPSNAIQVSSLSAALARLDGVPGSPSIELWFNGEKEESPMAMSPQGTLEIRAGAGFQPVVSFRPQETMSASSRRMVDIVGGKTVWTGVHFRMELPAAPSRGWALIGMQDVESLEFHDCTFTIQNVDAKGHEWQEDVAFLEILAQRLSRRMDMDMDMSMGSGAKTKSPAPVLPPFVGLNRCSARGQASFLRMATARPFHLVWNQGLLLTSARLVDTRGASEALPWDAEMRIQLNHLTAAVDGGLLMAKLDRSAPQLVDLNLELVDCVVLASGDRSLLDYRGVPDFEKATRSVKYRGDRNFYPARHTAESAGPRGEERVRWRMASPSGEERAYRFGERESEWYEEQSAKEMVIWKDGPLEPSAEAPHHLRTKAEYELDPSMRNPARSAGFEDRLLPAFPETSAGS